MDELVKRLSKGDHPVVASAVLDSVEEFKKSIDRGYVHIKFTDTKGGTELGIRLDNEASDLSKANFNSSKGKVHLEGTLTLNYVNVRCIADIDLGTLQGKGHLKPV
jgi:hypothetical protein